MKTQFKQHMRDAKDRIQESFPSYERGEIDNWPESILISAAAITAGVLMRRALMVAWKAGRKTEPPYNPADEGVTWGDALIWAAAVGTAVGVARVFGRRGSTALARRYYRI